MTDTSATDGMPALGYVSPGGSSPFLDEETGIHMQTQDFRVSFNEARLASPS